MISKRTLSVSAALACLAFAPGLWAAPAMTMPVSEHVVFNVHMNISSAPDAVADAGTLTIICQPRTDRDIKHSPWIQECNKMGQAVIADAVAENLIEPVTGAPFVKTSPLSEPGGIHLSHLKFSRSFPLASGGA